MKLYEGQEVQFLTKEQITKISSLVDSSAYYPPEDINCTFCLYKGEMSQVLGKKLKIEHVHLSINERYLFKVKNDGYFYEDWMLYEPITLLLTKAERKNK